MLSPGPRHCPLYHTLHRTDQDRKDGGCTQGGIGYPMYRRCIPTMVYQGSIASMPPYVHTLGGVQPACLSLPTYSRCYSVRNWVLFPCRNGQKPRRNTGGWKPIALLRCLFPNRESGFISSQVYARKALCATGFTNDQQLSGP